MNQFSEIKPKTECLLNGKRVIYDACSCYNLEDAKKNYAGVFEYFCSGNIIYINGVKNTFDKQYHFFKRIPK